MERTLQMGTPCQPDQLFPQLCFQQGKPHRNRNTCLEDGIYLSTEINQTVVLIFQDNRNDFKRDWIFAHIRHADGFFFPAQTAGTLAASWVAGKRTKGGMATLWNMELIIISDTLCWEKGDEGGEEAKVKNLNTNLWKSCQETLILLKVPWTFSFQLFDGYGVDNTILMKREILEWSTKEYITVSDNYVGFWQQHINIY